LRVAVDVIRIHIFSTRPPQEVPENRGGIFCMGAQTRTDILPYMSLIPVFGYFMRGTSTVSVGSLAEAIKTLIGISFACDCVIGLSLPLSCPPYFETASIPVTRSEELSLEGISPYARISRLDIQNRVPVSLLAQVCAQYSTTNPMASESMTSDCTASKYKREVGPFLGVAQLISKTVPPVSLYEASSRVGLGVFRNPRVHIYLYLKRRCHHSIPVDCSEA